MTEEPQQPEGETPEEELPPNEGAPGEGAPDEGAPGEPGESTPSESAPDPEAPGPEIEGLEELDQAETAEEAAPAEERPRKQGKQGGDKEPEVIPGAHLEPDLVLEEQRAEGDESPAAPEAPGPEIEGLEELDQAAEQQPAEEKPAEAEAEAPQRPARERGGRGGGDQEEVIPGAHLEPDLVLEEQRQEGEYGEYDEYADSEGATPDDAEAGDDGAEPAPVAHTPLELAADARYNATGKRKRAVARVILKPGEGTYTVNGRHLDEYFPRVRLQRMASQPLEAAGYQTRMDVVARIHGGGVSAQATALRHGVARALVEADPALRTEMKRRGYLTRDPRQKERKKAGLKKARKRPQFSKR